MYPILQGLAINFMGVNMILKWILDNKEWLFSGVAVAIIGWFFSNRGNKQIQKSGDNSTNIQVSGSFKIGGDKHDQ
jgi:hypothetical protein